MKVESVGRLARKVKAGVKLLDKRVPNWRTTMRKHAAEFDFSDGDHCVLGTLEHHNGRMKTLNARRGAVRDEAHTFTRAETRLGIGLGIGDGDSRASDYGFDGSYSYGLEDDMPILSELWRAEFEA